LLLLFCIVVVLPEMRDELEDQLRAELGRHRQRHRRCSRRRRRRRHHLINFLCWKVLLQSEISWVCFTICCLTLWHGQFQFQFQFHFPRRVRILLLLYLVISVWVYTQSNAKGIFGVPTACQINCFVISRPL